MSDVADAVSQDEVADSLLSAPVVTEGAAEHTGAEPEVEAEVEQQATGQEEVEQEQTDDWLPTEQEKVFPNDVLEQYAAKRYPKILAMVKADPDNADLRQLLHDKLNSDIHLRDQQSRQEQVQEEEEETPAARQEPTPPLSMEQHLEHVGKIAESITDPKVAMMFASEFMKAFGVTEAPTPELAKGLTTTLTKYTLNLLNSILPQMLTAPMEGNRNFIQSLIEQSYEGFGETHEQQMYERAWQKVVNSDPKYKSLPGFRDAGSDELRIKAAEQFAGSVDEFEAMQFRGKDGKALSTQKNAEKKYGILARMMQGEKVTPAEAAKFMEAGKKAERRNSTTRSAGNVSSGKSNQQITSQSGTFQTNNDLFDGEALDMYRRQHGRL